jgi:hypothetical protein
MKRKTFILVVGLLLLGLFLVACNGETEPCPTAEPCPDCPEATCPEPEPCPECEACPEPEACPECPEAECPEAGEGVPFYDMWVESGHADAEAEAFRHWDEDDPAVVPGRCAKCHSAGGAQDFFGADGTEARVVDGDHPIDTTISCVACHNSGTVNWDTVVFPSGAEISGLGPEARCMECHQGRASKVSVDSGLEEAGVTEDLDTVSEDVGFTNIHYFAAAASMYGTLAQGGYEYDGKAYDAKNDHVEGFSTCVGCHSPHTLELQMEACAECHGDGDPKDYRMAGSLVDYDGDGDAEEGIYYEIEGLQEALYGAMQAYGEEVAGSAIVYDAGSYPYFFDDAGERYASWTGRLAKAAYNYQTSLKDPGAYAHGGKYIIQLLYDSIEDLNSVISSPVDMSGMHRIDHGHFAGSEEAFRHWDEDGGVSASCATCHSADGLPFLLEHGVQIEQEISNGFLCATCHNEEEFPALYEITEVTFPSGATVGFEQTANNLCLNCHQGRESTVSVDQRIGDAEDDAVAEGLGFVNVHYFAAGATLFGGDVMGAYQYADKEYVGRFAHVEPYSSCAQCHDAHKLEVKADECTVCHAGIEDLHDIRMDATDYDGDGDTAEGIAGEIETMTEVLYAAILAYSADTVGTPIVYDSHSYPYFFTDTNGDGEATPDEANFGNRYATWTPALLRAAYNYQYAQKDPGAFAHNAKYVMQVLYDSIEALGGDASGMTRP